MTATDLGERMGLTESGVVRLEANEQGGRIRLDTLKRAAEALDCELVYALVPRTSLEDRTWARAREVARAELARVDHTMLLEDQLVRGRDDANRVDAYAAELLEQSGLWRDAR